MPDLRSLAPRAIVVLAAVAYPLVSLAGGAPSFPSREDCVRPATRDGDIHAVFGYLDSEQGARRLQESAVGAGFTGVSYERNACGRTRVFLPGIPTLAVGREFAEQAQGAGFEVTLEQAG